MIWFFIIIAVVLAIYVIKNSVDHRKQEQLQKGSVDALIATIGETDQRQQLAQNYLENLERTLSLNDYETMIQNMCVAAGITPKFNDSGRVNNATVDTLIDAFAEYAHDLHTTIRKR